MKNHKRAIFGTDGVRGLANVGWLSPSNILKLAQAAALHFTNGDHKHRVIIGKDTRLSGYMIEPALTAGFISMGMDVILVGPLPTPAIAMLTRSLRADLGVMISASHNPYQDNGLKFFDARGLKLPDDVEGAIETIMAKGKLPEITHKALGKAQRLDDALGRYIEYLKNAFPKELTLENLHVVLDCANGASYKVAPSVFWELGAKVTVINAQPDGWNINEACGATCTERLEAKVKELGADIGVALDGDADRLAIVDEKGKTVHGDHLLGAIATFWEASGCLSRRTSAPCIVGTVMCNKGLEAYLGKRGIQLLRAQVGDRYVAQMMNEVGANLGGEPSGHIIMSDYTTTGDGILSALQILASLITNRAAVSSLHDSFQLYPQTLVNITCSDRNIMTHPAMHGALEDLQKKLRAELHPAYVLIRPSGTEPLIRLMIQSPEQKQLQRAKELAQRHLEELIASFSSEGPGAHGPATVADTSARTLESTPEDARHA